MDIKEIKSVIDLMTKNGLSEFELEKPEFKIRVKKGANGELVPVMTTSAGAAPAMAAVGTAPAPTAVSAAPAAAPVAAPVKEVGGGQIVSPMVGTFYSAASPESEAYVKVGQTVEPETVVCIIEAMKVMNEIKAEVKGVVTEILAQNGKPVEFGKPLFAVKLA